MVLVDVARAWGISLAFILLPGSFVRASADPFSYTTVDAGPQPGQTVLTAVNDSGQIVGYSFGNGPLTNFLDSNGSIDTLTIPVAYDVFHATGITNAGQIVGFYSSDERDRTVFRRPSFIRTEY